jgi:hypothetical protein
MQQFNGAMSEKISIALIYTAITKSGDEGRIDFRRLSRLQVERLLIDEQSLAGTRRCGRYS